MTNDPGLVVYETVDASNRPIGTVKIRSAKVVRADQPYSRFEVDLTIGSAGRHNISGLSRVTGVLIARRENGAHSQSHAACKHAG